MVNIGISVFAASLLDKMRIALIAPEKSIHVDRWCEYCLELGFEVYYIKRKRGSSVPGIREVLLPQPCPKFSPQELSEELEILRDVPEILFHDKVGYAGRLKTYREILKTIAPDVIHSHWVYNTGLNGALASEGIAPFIQSVWGSDVFIIPMLKEEKFHELRQVLSRADMILGNSRTLVNTALGFLDSRPGSFVFKWGIKSYFNPDLYNREALREKYGYQPDDVIVLSARGFKPIYNVRNVLRAFYQANRKNPQLKLILLGEGYEMGNHPIVDNGNVCMMSPVSHRATAELMALSDISISIPYSDSMANTLVESLAMNLYLVASDLQPAKEFLKNEVHAVLVNPADVDAISDALLSYFDEPHLKEKFRLKSKFIREEFSEEKALNHVKLIYETVCGKQ